MQRRGRPAEGFSVTVDYCTPAAPAGHAAILDRLVALPRVPGCAALRGKAAAANATQRSTGAAAGSAI